MLRSKGIDGNLVETIREMLSMATMSDGKDSTRSNIGSMQGSTLSPLLFAFYINGMLEKLQQFSKTLALADDLVSECKGELMLSLTINMLEKNCKELGLRINKAKSGIMILRESQRQKFSGWNNYMGYPIVKTYKYLGIRMQDDGKLGTDLAHRKEIKQSLKKKMWLI